MRTEKIRRIPDDMVEHIHIAIQPLSESFKKNGFKICADFIETIVYSREEDDVIICNLDYLIRRFLEKYPDMKSTFNNEINYFYQCFVDNGVNIEKINSFTMKRISWFSIFLFAAFSIFIIILNINLLLDTPQSSSYSRQPGIGGVIMILIIIISWPIYLSRKKNIIQLYKWDKEKPVN